MKTSKYYIFVVLFIMMSCSEIKEQLSVEVYETSKSGNKHAILTEHAVEKEAVQIKLLPEEKFQLINKLYKLL